MTPQERLAVIQSYRNDNWFVDNPNGGDVNEEIDWLIARVEQLEYAVRRADELFGADRQRTEVLKEALSTGPKSE